MSAVMATRNETSREGATVVVGSGPVGVRVVQELLRHRPGHHVVLCGAESHEPYNRVRLSSFLMGELQLEDLSADLRLPNADNVERRLGCAIVSIDRDARQLIDARGRVLSYGKLVLALGSAPHIPAIPNVDLPGVFTFRDFVDAEKLFARRIRSRRTVVIGGGLLGLEAARAMHCFHTEVVVVEHNERLMPRQLDVATAETLRRHVEALGIEVVLNDGVRVVRGRGRVEGVELHSGLRIDCDTIVVATGIRPNIDLARRAGLPVSRGIRIDDAARTADPDVYAAGECAEHRGIVYGLLAPGLEQASVAAANIAGIDAAYPGSTAATKLKVVGLPVFSIGRVAEEDSSDRCRRWHFRDAQTQAHVSVVIERGRIIGAAAVGANEQLGRLQEAVKQQRPVWAWQLWRFRRTGLLWPPAETQDVASWPASTTVCNCTGVTRGALTQAIAAQCTSVTALSARTGAGSVCGSCKPLLQQLLGGTEKLPQVHGAQPLLALSLFSACAALFVASPWNFPDPASVQSKWQFSFLWRDAFFKQVSGYTLLALSVATLLLSPRKRLPKFRWGDFSLWRVAHTVIGALAIAALLFHTGGRLGANLNFALATSFAGLIVAGSISSGIIANEHHLGAHAGKLRRRSVWAHILLFWPLPVLLGFHILQAYFF